MSTRRWFTVASLISLVITVASAAPEMSAASAPWKTIATKGRVESRPPVQAAQAWASLSRGSEVASLSHVRTFDRARATLTRNGDLILVAAGSEVVLPEQQPDGTTVVLQQSGHAIYKVAPRTGGGRFEVQTPFLVAGVKGTRFSVILEKDRAAVSVLEGVVEVRSSITGETIDLTAGMVAVVGSGLDRMETYDESGRERPAPADKDKREGRGKKGGENAEKHPVTLETTESIQAVDEPLMETLRISEKLADSLVETDASLEPLDLNEDEDLWGDLLLDGKSTTHSTTTELDETTTRLDPTTSDPKSDPSLITKLIKLLER
jgi:hypothetical protein